MAVVPICFKMCYRNCHLTAHETDQDDRSFIRDGGKFPIVSGCIYSDFKNTWGRCSVVCARNSATTIAARDNLSRLLSPCRKLSHYRTTTWRKDKLYVCYAYDRSCNEQQIKALDSYFEKLQNEAYLSTQDDSEKEIAGISDEFQSRTDLSTLEPSLGKLENTEDTASQGKKAFSPLDMPASDGSLAPPSSLNKNSKRSNWRKYKGRQTSQALQQFDEASDLYLISIIVSVNIAVFLFEIASPVRYSELGVFSIPLLYGAKINQLILVGEWWRLLTPMFLVQDRRTQDFSMWLLVVGHSSRLGLKFAEAMAHLHSS